MAPKFLFSSGGIAYKFGNSYIGFSDASIHPSPDQWQYDSSGSLKNFGVNFSVGNSWKIVANPGYG